MATSTPPYRKKLIEVALPLDAINEASAREKSIRHGHPSTLHLWWARRPLAAARAVLFAQLVDDPSGWPELFPTEEAQEKERQRLFDIIRAFVPWEATNDETKINAARREIARSWARSHPSDKAKPVLAEDCSPADVNDYLATELPPVHDPFAGGGTIPLEAQRLGLRAIATDLNPVAVLINKALIEIPPRFAGKPPVNPEDGQRAGLQTWTGAQGLAADVRYYGAWIRDEAKRRIGHLYPDLEITKEMSKDRPDLQRFVGKKVTVIAWLWARTVASPNPALRAVHVPLVSTFWLSKMKGQEAWLSPVLGSGESRYTFEVRTGKPVDEGAVSAGTKLSGASFRCILSGTPIEPDYIREEGRQGRVRTRLLAVVCDGPRARIYLPPNETQEELAAGAQPEWVPEEELPAKALGFRVQNYGLTRWSHLFTNRQLVALSTFSELASQVGKRVMSRVVESTAVNDRATYGAACSIYAALIASSLADRMSTLCTWDAGGPTWGTKTRATFGRQALPMTWDFAEVNPFSGQSGSFDNSTDYTVKPLIELGVLPSAPVEVRRADASSAAGMADEILSTDPPYYDNVPYADLSDYFYVWLRRSLKEAVPDLFTTLLVPKEQELVADPFRHGTRERAEDFFLKGMLQALRGFVRVQRSEIPATVYYAFKQSEVSAGGVASTGWETFLEAILQAGFAIVGTWPLRTELSNRMRGLGSNALASSVVLVCRTRPVDAPAVTRSDFRRLLRAELPAAVKALQHGNIAPVDLAQASIGPGMAIFSRHAKVMEADGTPMSVRSALQLINEALDEYLTAQEGEADADTRFALTWFETNGWSAGSFGDAETLAKARNISVAGIVESGILHSAAGKVRLLKRSELPADWDPRQDTRIPMWEATQHLIRRLEDQGESGAAALYRQLGPLADHAHDLAYRLYNTCERKGWAEDARAYNGLVTAWPEIGKLAASIAEASPVEKGQIGLGLAGTEPPPAKKKTPRKSRKST